MIIIRQTNIYQKETNIIMINNIQVFQLSDKYIILPKFVTPQQRQKLFFMSTSVGRANSTKMRIKKANENSSISLMENLPLSLTLDERRIQKSKTIMLSKINMFDQSQTNFRQLSLNQTFKTADIHKKIGINFGDELHSGRIKTERISDSLNNKRGSTAKVIYYRKNNSIKNEKKPANPQKISQLYIGRKTIQNRPYTTLIPHQKSKKRERNLSSIRQRPMPINMQAVARPRIIKKNSLLSPW